MFLYIKNPPLPPQWRRSGVFIVNFEHISYFTPCCSVSIANFEQVHAAWVYFFL